MMFGVRAHFSWQSLCTPQTPRQSGAARLSCRGSDALLRIITPPPDTQRHFKSTLPPPPPPCLSSSLISLVQEEITVSFIASSLSLTHTKTLHSSLGSSYTVQRLFIGHSTVSTSLKTGLIIQAFFFFTPSPPAIIYRSSSHYISDKYLHCSSLGAHVSCTVGMQDQPLTTGCCGG